MRGQRLSGDFWRFFTGQTISNLGSSFTFFALPLLVYELTGSAVNLAATTAAYLLPYLLFGLVIGAWVDRVDRKRLMIAVDIGRAAAIATVPALAAADALSVWWIYGMAFVTATLTIAFDACEFAAVPSLVGKEDLVTANGRIQASYQGATFLGPILAGVMLGSGLPVEDVLLVDAASFLASAAALALVRSSFNPPDGETRERTTIRRDVVEGLRYVVSHPVLRNISIMMALFNFVAATTTTQLILFAKERLDASNAQVGFLYSAGSAGIVVLSLAAGPIRRRLSFSVAALGALMLYGLLTVGFALTELYWPALALWALISGLGLFFNINTQSLRQQIVPSHMLGRVMSIAAVLAWSAIPLGTLLGGWLIEETGNVAGVYAAVGVITFLIAFCFRFTALGHAEDYIEEAPREQAGDELEAAAEPAR